MKKNLLYLFFSISSSLLFAQNPNSIHDDFTQTPCQVAWTPVGPVQGFTGDDFISDTFNIANGSLDLTSIVSTQSTPYYYALTNSLVSICGNEMGLGGVDISGHCHIKFRIKARASSNTTVQVYIQEGNTPSYDLSKCSSTILKMNLTTNYQNFDVPDFSATSAVQNSANIDLTNIGMIVFEAKDGSADVDFSGVIQIDEITIGTNTYICEGVEENEAESFFINVHPSPSSDNLMINYISLSNSIITISDINGKIIEKHIANQNSPLESIDVSKMNSGLYIISISSDEGVATSKFVVE